MRHSELIRPVDLLGRTFVPKSETMKASPEEQGSKAAGRCPARKEQGRGSDAQWAHREKPSSISPVRALDYLPVESPGISAPPPATEPRLGRRTALTLPLRPPPQKN